MRELRMVITSTLTEEEIIEDFKKQMNNVVYEYKQMVKGKCNESHPGLKTNIRCLGTLAERPATPAISFMMYYSTDKLAYST